MNNFGVIGGGALCVLVGIAILVASARVSGGSLGGRFAGIGAGLLMLAAGLVILLSNQVEMAVVMPVLIGAAVIGMLGGLAAKSMINHKMG